MASATTDRRQGLTGDKGFKAPVQAATTANIVLSGEQTIDGVAVKAIGINGYPDRVLVWNQTNPVDNGIWDVSTASWTRSQDSNGTQDLVTGTMGLVTGGSSYTNQQWILTTTGIISPGSTAMVFKVGVPSLPILAASSGGGLIGWIQSAIGAVATTIDRVFRRRLNVSDFLPLGFNVQTTDCTPYIQLAVNYAANGISDWFGIGVTYNTPRLIEFETNYYKVLGTVYIPTGIVIDLNKSTLAGSGFTVSDNVMFETGYVSGGVVVSNIASPNEVNRVTDCQVRNGKIVNCYKGFNLKNFNENCSLSQIVFSNVRISFKAYRCFYADFSMLFSRSDAVGLNLSATESSYWFLSSVNAIGCRKVYTNGRVTGWLIDGAAGEGTRAMILDNCGAEQCQTGLQTLNSLQPISVKNSYFEFCSAVGVDLFNAGALNIDIDNNWFGSCGIGVRADTIAGGKIGMGNTFVSCTSNVTIASNTAAQVTVEIPPSYVASNAASIKPSLPAGYTLGRGIRTIFPSLIYNSATGQPYVRQNYTGGLIDLPWSGESGYVAGKVAFCDISYSGGTVNYNAYVDSKVVYDDFISMVFSFNCVDSNFNDWVKGRISGTDVMYDRQDHGKTVAVSNVGGFVRLTVGLLNGAGGTATITGIARHM